jgi:hypothetical protein
MNFNFFSSFGVCIMAKVFVSIKRSSNGTVWLTTKRYSVWTRATDVKVLAHQSSVSLDGRIVRIATDGSVLKQVEGRWVEVA